MKTHVLKPQIVVALDQLRLPVGAQGERRMAAPDGMLPEMRKGLARLRKIARKILHSFSLLRLDSTGRDSHKDRRFFSRAFQDHSMTSLMASGGCCSTNCANWLKG